VGTSPCEVWSTPARASPSVAVISKLTVPPCSSFAPIGATHAKFPSVR
jgi:hypothetical protein